MDALKKAGLFDEQFFLYTEDADLTRRIQKYYRTVFFPHVTIYHHHARGSYKDPRLMLYNIISAIKYFNKWGWFFDAERDRINNILPETLKGLKVQNEPKTFSIQIDE
jgi:GT2 family glycosyltransferase